MSSSRLNNVKNKDCQVCRHILQFLILTAVLVMLMWLQPDWHLPAGDNDTTRLGDGFLWTFLALFGYTARQHYKDSDR